MLINNKIIENANSGDSSPVECKFVGKTVREYDLYSGDTDFYLLIKKHYNFEYSGLYQVIYEDAYETFSGELLSSTEIKNKYNITLIQ